MIGRGEERLESGNQVLVRRAVYALWCETAWTHAVVRFINFVILKGCFCTTCVFFTRGLLCWLCASLWNRGLI